MYKGKICFMTCARRTEQMVVQRRQAKLLQNEGYELSFIVADDFPREVIDGITYYPAGSIKGNYFKRFFMLGRHVGKIALEINADIYQTETPDLLGVCVDLKKLGKRVFFNMLEGHPYSLYNKLKYPLFIKKCIVETMAYKMSRQLRQLDYVFAVSEDIISCLDAWGVEKKVLLGNFPEVNKDFSLSKEEYLAREPKAIYYGHIPNTSRQENVFKALSHLPELKYLLAGKFWNVEYLNTLRQNDYWDKVEFIDGFDRKELPAILSRCTISNVARDLSSSKLSNGSLGILKIFESMEAALPLLLPDLPVYREMVDKYHCGVLVDINDISSIERGLRFLLDNKEVAYEMGQNGRKAVLSEYSWDVVSILYKEIILTKWV